MWVVQDRARVRRLAGDAWWALCAASTTVRCAVVPASMNAGARRNLTRHRQRTSTSALALMSRAEPPSAGAIAHAFDATPVTLLCTAVPSAPVAAVVG